MDLTYHSRHLTRSTRKARLIAQHISKPSTILDIGCNQGVMSHTLHSLGAASTITGLDLDYTPLVADLSNSEYFSFRKGNIVDITLDTKCEIALHLAVHHHIVNQYGLQQALLTLRKIARQTERHIFFETGKIIEGSYWDWQPSIRRHFRYDEEHYHCIIEALEDLITGWHVIGYNYIHGIRREIIRFDLLPPESRSSPAHGQNFPVLHDIDVNSGNNSESFLQHSGASELSSIHVLRHASAQDYLCKQTPARPMAQLREFLISRSIHQDWAVRALGYSSCKQYLVFPYIRDAKAVNDIEADKPIAPKELRPPLKEIRSTLKKLPVVIPRALHPGQFSESSAYDICDVNPSNMLITEDPHEKMRIFIVDFAFQSPSYSWKNDLNFSAAHTKLHGSSLTSVLWLISGYCKALLKLVLLQAQSRKSRIEHRFPSLLSALITDFTNSFGRKLRALRAHLAIR